MAQTKRKRRSKHRGNAAGVVETRGRTGRVPTPAERKAEARAARALKAPSWRRAILRSVGTSLALFVALVLVMHQSVAKAAPLTIFMMIVYAPMGYFMDQHFYRRHQQKTAGKA